MEEALRKDAQRIVEAAIEAVKPDGAVKRALRGKSFAGRVLLVAVGKAAWQMANAAFECMGDDISEGIVLTKYGHLGAPLPRTACFEGGHPITDEAAIKATKSILEFTACLCESDTVLFLLSGGGSALFEKPLIPAEELRQITSQLLRKGADIVEMNTVRKRLSAVKGGRFATWCAPAQVYSVVLSDILGDPVDMIASGPAVADPSTCGDALKVVKKYALDISEKARVCLTQETPKRLENTEVQVIGSVKELCLAAGEACKSLGYTPVFLTDTLDCEAREAGRFLASIVCSHQAAKESLAFIAGGETIVNVRGDGLGGRNQELALAAAKGIAGIGAVAVCSVGSDGTDGPTDAAGGYVDGDTMQALCLKGIDHERAMANNDAYHALQAVDGLIITGPTGTNVNDVSFALLRR